jgi:hypothetical protein
MRIATKYPKIAARHFERTGRQAEIVEVKGSVELAPLTGLVEGSSTSPRRGTTLRENGLVVREEIAVATARLIANPVAHKLKAQAIDDVVSACVRAEWIECPPARPPRRRRGCGAWCPPGASVAADVAGSSRPSGRGDAGRARARAPVRRRRRAPARGRPRARAALAALDPAVRDGLEIAIANVGRVAAAGATTTATSRWRRASPCAARDARAPRRGLRPGGRRRTRPPW